MATKGGGGLRGEVQISDASYMLTISPEGLKIVPKGKRNGIEVTWKSILGQSGDAVSGNPDAEM